MAFWTIDLTTRDGAENAAKTGGTVCFVATGLTVLGAILFSTIALQPGTTPVEAAVGGVVEAIIFLIAGFRLRGYKGAFWGSAAVLVLFAELLFKIVTLSFGGIIMNIILMIAIANGVRGAFALRSGKGFYEDEAEVFS